MNARVVRWYAGLAGAGAILAASAACSLHPTPSRDAEVADVRRADSARAARDERGRSSASQAIEFRDGKDGRFARVEQMIQGRFSGVTVTPTASGGFFVRIRGIGTLNAGTEPVYVVDGVTMRTGGSGLVAIDPADVVRIEILKDAGALAIYRARGANGAIIITTKRGR